MEKIEERIHLAKMMLQRLRLGVLAQHYGVTAFYPTALDYREETIGEQRNWEAFEEYMTGQDVGAESAPSEAKSGLVDQERRDGTGADEKGQQQGDEEVAAAKSQEEASDSLETLDDDDVVAVKQEISAKETPLVPMETSPPPSTPPVITVQNLQEDKAANNGAQDSRFYFKKRVIVGNTSQYLDPAAHHIDGSTHKWMVYVRGPQAEPGIGHFVQAVRFFLHPSYHPNDIVHVRSPPFHLTRLGWGEFPIRVQLEFCDKFNKSVDIIHNLVLDRTHTGQQTLGAETVVDLDIVVPPPGGDRRTFRRNGVSIASSKCGKELISPSSIAQPSSPLLPEPPPSSTERDSSTAPSTPTSQHEQAMPLSLGGVSVGVLTTNLDKCLHNAARSIPIYGKCSPGEDFFIPAPSLTQFRQWNVGRRRATEWERAVAMKRSIERKLKLPSLLSTKQVMQWCRQNGYTPLDPVPPSGRGFCKVCGCQLKAGLEEDEEDWVEDMEEEGSEGVNLARRCPEVHEHCQVLMFGRHGLPLRGTTMDPFEELYPNTLNTEEEGIPRLCSLSQPHELVERMFSRQGRLEERAKKQEEEVDVCSMPSSPSCARSRALVDMVPRFRVPQTPELKWVQQTAAAIGIHIYPAVIDRMYAHVIEHMIYISCTRFLKGVLAQAVQGAGQMLEGKLSKDRVLSPFHVQQAILKLEQCDFLTNHYLGISTTAACRRGGGASLPTNSVSDDNESSSSAGSTDDEA